jgi:hypothetical protein
MLHMQAYIKKQAVKRNKRPYFQSTTWDYLRRAGVDNLIGQKISPLYEFAVLFCFAFCIFRL